MANGFPPDFVATIWQNVIRIVNKLVETHDNYGFGKFKEGMNPNLDMVIAAFTVADGILKTLIASSQLDTDEYRHALNARQCIYHTKHLALALDADNEEEYARLIDLLTKQAPI
jgi:hypothetical protein